MKKVTLATKPRKTIIVNAATRARLDPIIPAEWVPISRERPPRNAWIVFWHREGFTDTAHEWRDEQHLEHATHWLRGYPPGRKSDGASAVLR